MDLGERANVLLRAIQERTDDGVPPTIRNELWRHGRELAREEQVQEQRLEYIVSVMPDCDLRASKFRGHAVENPTTEARVQGTEGLSRGDLLLDDGVRVLLHHREVVTLTGHVLGEHVPRVARVALV